VQYITVIINCIFASEMKYLYENGFMIITVKDLGHDEMSNRLYVKSAYRLIQYNLKHSTVSYSYHNNKPTI
jgi:hypothetical protein